MKFITIGLGMPIYAGKHGACDSPQEQFNRQNRMNPRNDDQAIFWEAYMQRWARALKRNSKYAGFLNLSN